MAWLPLAGYRFGNLILRSRNLFRAFELAPLAIENTQIERKHAQEQGLDVAYECGTGWDVPAKMVPHLTAPVANPRVPYALADVAHSDVNGHRAVVKNVDPLPAFTASRD